MASINTTAQLREKEIINVCDGVRLGRACDFVFDICDAKITALIVNENSGILGLGKQSELLIPWCKIECIGEDTILVKLTDEDRKSGSDCKGKCHKKWF